MTGHREQLRYHPQVPSRLIKTRQRRAQRAFRVNMLVARFISKMLRVVHARRERIRREALGFEKALTDRELFRLFYDLDTDGSGSLEREKLVSAIERVSYRGMREVLVSLEDKKTFGLEEFRQWMMGLDGQDTQKPMDVRDADHHRRRQRKAMRTLDASAGSPPWCSASLKSQNEINDKPAQIAQEVATSRAMPAPHPPGSTPSRPITRLAARMSRHHHAKHATSWRQQLPLTLPWGSVARPDHKPAQVRAQLVRGDLGSLPHQGPMDEIEGQRHRGTYHAELQDEHYMQHSIGEKGRRIYMHVRTHACMHAHTCTHTCTHVCTHARARTNLHAHAHT